MNNTKELKKLSKETMDKIIVAYNDLSQIIDEDRPTVTVDDITYYVDVIEGLDQWSDDGKYSNNTTVGQICSMDTDKWEQSEIFDNYVEQENMRSGSYFSDYDYTIGELIEVYPHTEIITKEITTWNVVK